MKTIADLLRDHPFFEDFDDDTVALLAGCARIVHLRPGEAMFREGAEADAFFVMRSGRVAVQSHAPAAGAALIDTVEDDDVIGWSWLVPPYRWQFDAVAVTETSAVRFEAGCLRDKCSADPAVGYAFLRRVTPVVAHRLTSARRRLLDVYGGTP